MRILSRRTILINRHTETIKVQATRNKMRIIDKFNVAIEPSQKAYVYYSDLGIPYNPYSEVIVTAFLVGQEDRPAVVVNTSVVRDNEVIVFGYEKGMVTAKPTKGKLLARIRYVLIYISSTYLVVIIYIHIV